MMKVNSIKRVVFLLFLSTFVFGCALFGKSETDKSLQGAIDDGQTSADGEFNNRLEYVDQYGGSTVTVAVNGKYAYIGQGPRMAVLDVSNSAAPVQIGESELLPGLVTGIHLDGELAYVTTLFSGLHIFDIHELSNPVLLSSIQPKHPGCHDVTVVDGIAYLACNPGGLYIVDVSDPKDPQELSSDVIPTFMWSIAVKGQYAYLASVRAPELVVVDISDPSNPKQVGFFNAKDVPVEHGESVSFDSVRFCGDNLCLAAGQGGLVILSLANPSSPSFSAMFVTLWSQGLVADGSLVYLQDGDGIYILDISNPAHPQKVGILPYSDGFEFAIAEVTRYDLFVADHKLYVPDQRIGLRIVDVSDAGNPLLAGQYITPASDVLGGIKVVGDYAYLIGRNVGFRVLDVSDPANMQEVFYDDERKDGNTQNPSGLDVIGNYAYISDANYPFHVYDISNPKKPVQVSAVADYAASDGAHDLVISGNAAYLSGWGLKDAFYPGRGLWVIDITNPLQPQPVNFVDLPNDRWTLSIVGSTLYALDGAVDNDQLEPLSLRILDVADPFHPVVVNTVVIPEMQVLSPSDVIASGSTLYLAMGLQGLKIFDITDPEQPAEISTSPIMGAVRLSMEEPYLFINGNMVYDVSDRTQPEIIAVAREAMFSAWTCDMKEDMLFITTTFNGVYAYRLK